MTIDLIADTMNRSHRRKDAVVPKRKEKLQHLASKVNEMSSRDIQSLWLNAENRCEIRVFDRFKLALPRSRNAIATAILLMSVATLGCGKPSYGDRVAIAGTVLLAGEPLQIKASIALEPEDTKSAAGKAAIGTMGEVKAGKFSIPKESGPSPGLKYNVVVTTYPGIPAPDTPKDQIKVSQRYKTTVEIPPKGSQTLEIEVQ